MKVREKSKDQFWPFRAFGSHVEGGASVRVPSGVGRFVIEAARQLGHLLVRPRSFWRETGWSDSLPEFEFLVGRVSEGRVECIAVDGGEACAFAASIRRGGVASG